MLVEESTVPSAALPVAKFKDHLRFGSGFADDALQDEVLEGYLRAAIAAIEARTGKITIERAFSATFTSWSKPNSQPLSIAPVVDITAITLVDSYALSVSADLADVRLEQDMHRPKVVARTATLPSIPHSGHAKIDVVAGYGPDWADLPSDLAQAVMLLAAHFYENRQDRSGQNQSMPFGVMSLIERFRNIRTFGGGAL